MKREEILQRPMRNGFYFLSSEFSSLDKFCGCQSTFTPCPCQARRVHKMSSGVNGKTADNTIKKGLYAALVCTDPADRDVGLTPTGMWGLFLLPSLIARF